MKLKLEKKKEKRNRKISWRCLQVRIRFKYGRLLSGRVVFLTVTATVCTEGRRDRIDIFPHKPVTIWHLPSNKAILPHPFCQNIPQRPKDVENWPNTASALPSWRRWEGGMMICTVIFCPYRLPCRTVPSALPRSCLAASFWLTQLLHWLQLLIYY
jgi:hypothetical protein